MTRPAITTPPALLVALLFFTGCGGCESCGAKPYPPAGSPRGAAKAPGEAEGASEPPPGRTGVEKAPAPAPRVEVLGMPDPSHREVGISVCNRDEKPVKLRATVGVERETGGAWQPFPVRDLLLRFGCDDPPRPCLELVPGAELLAPAWRAADGPSQCECDPCRPAQPGRYRLVLSGCEESWRAASPPFELWNRNVK